MRGASAVVNSGGALPSPAVDPEGSAFERVVSHLDGTDEELEFLVLDSDTPQTVCTSRQCYSLDGKRNL